MERVNRDKNVQSLLLLWLGKWQNFRSLVFSSAINKLKRGKAFGGGKRSK